LTKTVRATPAAAGHGPRVSDQLGGLIDPKDNAPAPANQELDFHPLADLFPLMEGEEFDALVEDIKTHGLLETIGLYDGKILDGRNRYRACLAAAVEPEFRAYKFKNSAEAAAHVISANIHRRHLTAEQKREIIAKLIKATPEKSNRQIAKQAKVHHETVASVRTEQEARGGIRHVEKRTDTKGRKQPTKKTRKPGYAQRDAEPSDDPKASAERMKAAHAAAEAERDERETARLFAINENPLAGNPKDRFTLKCAIACDAAHYDGPIDDEVIEAAAKVRNAWSDLASKLRLQLKAHVPVTPAADPVVGNDPGPIPACLVRT
jgi:hypothetical protein